MPNPIPAFESIRVERPDRLVLRIVLNRPDRLNALTWEMIDELYEALAWVASEHEARVLILTGAGKGFCAGLDIKDGEDPLGCDDDVFAVYRRQERVSGLVLALRNLPQVVIGAINGAAAGGGFGLALAADLRLCSPDAKFNAAFVRIGLSGGDVGVSYLLPRVVGLPLASDLLLTGRFVEPEEASRIGLVSRVVEADALADTALDLARQVVENSPYGTWMTKKLLRGSVDAPSLEAAMEVENRTQVLATRTNDAREAFAAFREGRPPRFNQS